VTTIAMNLSNNSDEYTTICSSVTNAPLLRIVKPYRRCYTYTYQGKNPIPIATLYKQQLQQQQEASASSYFNADNFYEALLHGDITCFKPKKQSNKATMKTNKQQEEDLINNNNSNSNNDDDELEELDSLQPGTLIRTGYTINEYYTVYELPPMLPTITTTTLPSEVSNLLSILYHSPRLIAVNKPASVLSVPSGGLTRSSMLYQLSQYLLKQDNQQQQSSTLPHLHVIHRLDAGTSGVLIFALDHETKVQLKSKIKERKGIYKLYVARVKGKLPLPMVRVDARILFKNGKGRIVLPVQEDINNEQQTNNKNNNEDSKSEAKPSSTIFYELWYDPNSNESLILCKLLTGRRHQLRLHLSKYLGMPIVDDHEYGGGRGNSGNETSSEHLITTMGYYHEQNRLISKTTAVSSITAKGNGKKNKKNKSKKNSDTSVQLVKAHVGHLLDCKKPSILTIPQEEDTKQQQSSSNTSVLYDSIIGQVVNNESNDLETRLRSNLSFCLHSWIYVIAESDEQPIVITSPLPWFCKNELCGTPEAKEHLLLVLKHALVQEQEQEQQEENKTTSKGMSEQLFTFVQEQVCKTLQ